MLDPITVEVIGFALSSIVDEMGSALIRSAYSTNIKERRDCSTVLFDAQGQTLLQAAHIPIHLGSLIEMIPQIVKRYPVETFAPGDVFIANDPFTGGSTHLNDLVLVSPVCVDDRVVAFVANVAHHADFIDRGHEHIFQEGLRIPPIKIFDAGRLRHDVLELLLLNFQVPEERRGDLRAQFACNRLGIRRFHELCGRYGSDTVAEAGDALLNYAERQTRAGIDAIPDGTYDFEDALDNEYLGHTALTLRARVTVRGDEVELDFRGNPPQVTADLNMVRTALLTTCYYVIKSVVDPNILPNAGLFRPITVLADPGTIVSCTEPAAVFSRTHTGQRVVDVILGALAQAVPEKVIAACMGSNAWVGFSGIDPRRDTFYTYPETIGGGFGARAEKDGMDGVQCHLTNTSNLPIESLEQEYPLLVERYELVPDSGGPGRRRGGLGIRRDIRLLRGTAVLEGSTSRRLTDPWGLRGGLAGGRASVTVNGNAALLDPPGRAIVEPGDVVSIVTAGGGGYGNPQARDRALVEADLIDGKITEPRAREAYAPQEAGLASTAG